MHNSVYSAYPLTAEEQHTQHILSEENRLRYQLQSSATVAGTVAVLPDRTPLAPLLKSLQEK